MARGFIVVEEAVISASVMVRPQLEAERPEDNAKASASLLVGGGRGEGVGLRSRGLVASPTRPSSTFRRKIACSRFSYRSNSRSSHHAYIRPTSYLLGGDNQWVRSFFTEFSSSHSTQKYNQFPIAPPTCVPPTDKENISNIICTIHFPKGREIKEGLRGDDEDSVKIIVKSQNDQQSHKYAPCR